MRVIAKIIIPWYITQLGVGNWQGNVQAHNVGECLDRLEDILPGIRDRIFNADGQIHAYINIFVNSRDIMWVKGLNTEVQETDEVYILPTLAGG